MTVKRFAWALVVAVGALGCGDSGGGGGSGGSSGYPNCPDCMHYQYVVGPMSTSPSDHGIKVPGTNSEATALGCDINGDNHVDNQLGTILVQLKALSSSFDVQASVDSSFMSGSIIILFDIEAKPSITNTTVAGAKSYLGAHDTSDGLQAPAFYMGNGKFTVTMAAGPGFAGKVTSGAASFGPGQLTVQFPLVMGQAPLVTDLIAATVSGTISATNVSNAKLCGAIPADEIKTRILPQIATLLSAQVKSGSQTGMTIKTLFDKNPTYPACANDPLNTNCDTDPNCTSPTAPNPCTCITACELENNSTIRTLLAPDLDLDPNKTNPFAMPGDPDYKNDALSVGLGFEANKASFPAQ